MRFASLLGLMGILCGLTPAQTWLDEFRDGFELIDRWSWQVAGNNPFDTLDGSRVAFDGDSLQITAQPGTLYQGYNSIRNLPSISVPPLRGEWRIETRLQLERGGVSGTYVQAGVVVFTDADNYFNLHLVYDPTQSHRLRVSGGHEALGVYQWAGLDSPLWEPAEGNTVRLLIRYDPATDQVHFFYDREDGLYWRPLQGSPRPLSAFASLQAVAQQGGWVGLYVDTAGGSGAPAPVARFDYLEVSIAHLPADVNMDGIVDDADLLAVLFDFGRVVGCNHPTDIDRNGVVDDADLLLVLFSFGAR